jgi:predicted aconitase
MTYTTANPGGADDKRAGERRAWESLGVRISYTCTPYLVGNHPNRGDVVAWGGRAAVAVVNSVMGARSEMETYETSLASALTGLTVERGLHLEQNRKAAVAVIVTEHEGQDLIALGHELAKNDPRQVPVICGIKPTFDEAKRLAFSLNSKGTLPLFHLSRNSVPPPGLDRIEIDVRRLDQPTCQDLSPDLIVLGCPHLSEQDINRWAKKLAGRPTTRTEVWFFTSRLCLEKCPVFGAVLQARGRMFVDRCPLGMKEEMAGKSVACDSLVLAECLSKAGLKAVYLPDTELLKAMCRKD